MMYFHTDSTQTVLWLANVMAQAAKNGNAVRLDVGSDGSLKVKVGEGVWTAPIHSTPDAYRDLPQRKDPLVEAAENAIALNEPVGSQCADCGAMDGAHYLDCTSAPWTRSPR